MMDINAPRFAWPIPRHQMGMMNAKFRLIFRQFRLACSRVYRNFRARTGQVACQSLEYGAFFVLALQKES
jgi:hypothetical protein